MTRRYVLAGVLAVSVLSACGGSSGGDNTDPRRGTVYIGGDNEKKCDGTTLVYSTGSYDGGISTIPNSPECQG